MAKLTDCFRIERPTCEGCQFLRTVHDMKKDKDIFLCALNPGFLTDPMPIIVNQFKLEKKNTLDFFLKK